MNYNHRSKSGRLIKAALDKIGATQADLANAIGLNKRIISDWCHDEHQPNVSSLARIAKAVGVTMESLVDPTALADVRPIANKRQDEISRIIRLREAANGDER